MTGQELAELLHVPVNTLHRWRQRGTGPASIKVGRHVRWRRSSVEAWLQTLESAGKGDSAA